MNEALSTEEKQQITEAPKPDAQGTALPPAPEQDTILPPKRNHNRRPQSTCKGRLPLTTAQKQEAVVLAAAGYAPSRVAKTMGKSRLMVKRHLETPEAIAAVRDERAEMVQLCRDKARACVVAIDDETIQKSSVQQLAVSAGILIDKAQLLDGMPTSINVVALMDVLDTLRQRMDEEEERQWQEDHAAHLAKQALLNLPANQAANITFHKPEGAL